MPATEIEFIDKLEGSHILTLRIKRAAAWELLKSLVQQLEKDTANCTFVRFGDLVQDKQSSKKKAKPKAKPAADDEREFIEFRPSKDFSADNATVEAYIGKRRVAVIAKATNPSRAYWYGLSLPADLAPHNTLNIRGSARTLLGCKAEIWQFFTSELIKRIRDVRR